LLDSYLKLVLAHSTFKHSDFPKPTSKQVTSTETTAENVEESREKYPSGKSSSLFEQPQLPADEFLFDSLSSEENIHIHGHACAEGSRYCWSVWEELSFEDIEYTRADLEPIKNLHIKASNSVKRRAKR
jgi:hypothetical protein